MKVSANENSKDVLTFRLKTVFLAYMVTVFRLHIESKKVKENIRDSAEESPEDCDLFDLSTDYILSQFEWKHGPWANGQMGRRVGMGGRVGVGGRVGMGGWADKSVRWADELETGCNHAN